LTERDDTIKRLEEEQEAALNQLAEMGFTDRNGNKKLLEQPRNDVATVVDLLSQEASTDQRRENEGGRGTSGESGGGGGRGSCLEEGRCKFDTSRNLGSGSFADVVGGTYRFAGQRAGTQVAFKIFRRGRNLASSVREKIKVEVELGMKLHHPNLVRVFGVLNHKEHGPVLVLELCPGGSLRQVLDRAHSGGITLPWLLRAKWLMQIASGMAHMHVLLPTRIIHRDLKAANVLLSATDLDKAVAKVGDFGMAMAMETIKSTQSAGGGLGTLAWMPPEAFEGDFSEMSDMFSFAVLMYEVLSLVLPHAGKSTAEIIKLAQRKFKVSKALEKRGVTAAEQEQEWLEENPLHTRRPDLNLVQLGCHPALLDWVVKSWSDNPDNRPTFREAVEFLGNLLKKRKFVFFSCRVGTKIDPELESQELEDSVFGQYTESIEYKHIPRPEIRHFTDELRRIKVDAVKVSLHFSGHGNRDSGRLEWNGVPGKTKMQISGDQLQELIKLQDAVANIDSFFLNACYTLTTGLELHAIGVRVVVCWQTSVPDETARVFATRFYELSCLASAQYATAFKTACTELSGALKKEKARPCLLQTGSGREESVQMWNGKKLVTIAHELLPHFLQPSAHAPAAAATSTATSAPSPAAAAVATKPTFTIKKKPKSVKLSSRGVGEEEEAAAAEEEEEEEDILDLISKGEASDSDDDEEEG
jgi:serine/threonine protein kinase